MNYLLLFFSILCETFKNSYTNHFSKKLLNSQADTYLFNAVLSFGAAVFFGVFGTYTMSQFSLIISIAFALVMALAQLFLVLAMSCGPMAYSVLLTYLGGILIPTTYSVLFLNQKVSVFQIVGLIVMLVSVFLGVGITNREKMSGKWLLLSAGSMVMMGLVGVCQQIHQSSVYRAEIVPFLFWAFLMMTVLFALFFTAAKKKKERHHYQLKSKSTILVLLTGLATGVINLINLYLSGVMKGIIFFPIVNGGVVVLSGLSAILIFREKLDKKQLAGVVLGTIAICLLSI